MNRIHTLHLAGLGDFLSFLTRTKAIKQVNPNHELVFYFGGYGRSPILCKEQAEREGYKASVIKNLTIHNQLPHFREWIKSNLVKDNDLFLDVSFCEEIFNNKEPEFFKYNMEDFYNYKTNIPQNYPFPQNVISIQPLTKSGSPEGFDIDLQQGRFWDRNKWVELCHNLIEHKFKLMFTGVAGEDWGIMSELYTKYGHNLGMSLDNCDYFHLMNCPIDRTIEMLKNCVGNIATNSWTWEVSARSKIPTICFYTKNQFFIPIHTPQRSSEIYDNLYIETNNQVEPEDIFDKFMYLHENKRKPEVKYTICNIARNDEETIQRTLNSIENYIDDEFVSIVDSKSEDKTKDILYNFQNKNGINKVKIIEKEWQNNFEIQKNTAIENSKNDLVLFIDSDEQYEQHFLNQINWHIRDMQNKNIDCFAIPRINIIEGLSDQELTEFCQSRGWNLSGFKWINYQHDAQKRLFNKKICSFKGQTHEQVVGAKKEYVLTGNHIIHRKSIYKQKKDLLREEYQYKLRAEEIKRKVYSE